MKKIFITFLVMLFSMSIYGQLDCNPTVNGKFVGQSLDLQNLTYSVTVQINVTDNNGYPVKLKEGKAKFTYNKNYIGFNNGEVLTFTQGYNTSVYLDGNYIVVQFEKCDSNWVSIGETYVDLAVLNFNVLDTTAYSDICIKKNKSNFKNNYDNNLDIGYWLCDEYSLPVELTQFSIRTNNNIVTLKWETATEINNYGFEIERNYDGWETIGFVAGNGNSNSPKYYTFTDTPTLSGLYQYRLKQIDTDGKFEYSNIIETHFEIDTYTLYQNYPNPFNPSTIIKYELKNSGNVKLIVYDFIGREVSVLVNEYRDSGIYYVKLDASNFASGLYIYKLIINDVVYSKKMTVLK